MYSLNIQPLGHKIMMLIKNNEVKTKMPIYTSIPGNLGVNGGIAFSVSDPLTRYPFPQSTASTCCTTLVKELAAPTQISLSQE